MPIISVTHDTDALTLTVVAEFPVPRERVWHAYTDPRQIERFWGPPTYPATFFRHDVFPGGQSLYAMTGPDGDVSRGYWEWVSVDAPNAFVVRDGFADAEGTPDGDMPTMTLEFSFEDTGDGSRVVTTSRFASADDLRRLLDMGMDEGMRAAMGQIDEVLADLTAFAAGRGTETTLLSDTEVRVSRVIRGSVEQVWDAHNDPALLQRWLLGPDGWEMPVCEVATAVGDVFRYEWAKPDGSERFGFTGELVASVPPRRSVTTERLIGTDGPSTRNELTLTPADGGTLLSLVITYPSSELRDTVLATGMVDGMEASYARMESLVLA